MTKQFTAKQMHNAPGQVYRSADKGNRTVITHDHYKDREFELVARDIDSTLNVCSSCKEVKPKTESGLSDCCDSYFVTMPKENYKREGNDE